MNPLPKELQYDSRWRKSTSRPTIHRDALKALLKAQSQLPPDYKLLVLDAFRSLAAQRKLVEETKSDLQKEYPERWEALLDKYTGGYSELKLKPHQLSGMNHRTGKAVDVSLLYKGKEVDMGLDAQGNATLSDADSLLYKHPNPSVQANREILKRVLRNNGFNNYPGEWWHWGMSSKG